MAHFRPAAGDRPVASGDPPVGPRADSTNPARGAYALAAAGLVAFVALAGWVSATSVQDGWDVRAQRELLGVQRPGLRDLARFGAAVGSPWLLTAVAVLGALTLWRRARRPVLAAVVLGVPLAVAGLVHVLDLAFAGRRPAFGHLLGLPVLGGSFPSARAADAGVLWGLLALAVVLSTSRPATRVLCGVGWLVLGGAVAWDQLARGRWPSDVLAGVLLAVAVVAACCGALGGWARAPVPDPGGRAAARLDR